MATDTMDAGCKSIHGERYCQVFGNKDIFVEAIQIFKKSDCHQALDIFTRKYGIIDVLEQSRRDTKF